MLCEILQWCSRAQVDARPGCVKYYSGAHTSQVDARPGCGGHEQQLPPVARAASVNNKQEALLRQRHIRTRMLEQSSGLTGPLGVQGSYHTGRRICWRFTKYMTCWGGA
jgi:hypothetical protein